MHPAACEQRLHKNDGVFMRSLLGIFALLGALAFSAVPTKAQQLDLGNVCASSMEAATVCAASYFHGAIILLCALEKSGDITSEYKNGIIQEIRESNEEFNIAALAAAIKLVRSQEPDCKI